MTANREFSFLSLKDKSNAATSSQYFSLNPGHVIMQFCTENVAFLKHGLLCSVP